MDVQYVSWCHGLFKATGYVLYYTNLSYILVCNVYKTVMQTANLIESSVAKELIIPGFTGQHYCVARTLNVNF